jgi:nucleotide-binding universal stress UspA family protein
MYKHILVPTDGSRLAARGIKAGVSLAKALRAQITGVYVIAPYAPSAYGDRAVMYYAYGVSPREHKKFSEKEANRVLAAVEREARAAGVRCGTQFVTDVQPWQGILRIARARKCDAIVMASHGHGAIGDLILGSVTSRVLAHSKIPVLVTR